MDYRSRYADTEQYLAIDIRTGTDEATARQPLLTYSVLRSLPSNKRHPTHNLVWVQGDRLDYLAHVHLGSPHLWFRIMDVNPHIADPHDIEPGTLLYMPLLGRQT